MKTAIMAVDVLPPAFNAIADGIKPFEALTADAVNQVNLRRGDILEIFESDPFGKGRTGKQVQAEVTFIQRGGWFGIQPGVVMVGFRLITAPRARSDGERAPGAPGDAGETGGRS